MLQFTEPRNTGSNILLADTRKHHQGSRDVWSSGLFAANQAVKTLIVWS